MAEKGERREVNRKWIFLGAAILWMAVIFYFSAQPGEMSSGESNAVSERLMLLLGPWIRALSPAAKEALFSTVDFVIRKAAHLAEYAILAILHALWICRSGAETGKLYSGRLALAWLLAAAYAATDEIHQRFVPGRSGEARDVLIDAIGALAGVLLMLAIHSLKRKKAAWKLQEKAARTPQEKS